MTARQRAKPFTLPVIVATLVLLFGGFVVAIYLATARTDDRGAANNKPCPKPPVAGKPAPSQSTKCLLQQSQADLAYAQQQLASVNSQRDKLEAANEQTAESLAQLDRLFAQVDLRPVPGSSTLVQILPAGGAHYTSPRPSASSRASASSPSSAASAPVSSPTRKAGATPSSPAGSSWPLPSSSPSLSPWPSPSTTASSRCLLGFCIPIGGL